MTQGPSDWNRYGWLSTLLAAHGSRKPGLRVYCGASPGVATPALIDPNRSARLLRGVRQVVRRQWVAVSTPAGGEKGARGPPLEPVL